MARLIRSRYEPIEVIGRGGQGHVVRAVDRQHDRPVALKVRRAGSQADRQALLSEARILLGLRPHAGLPLVREDFFVRDRYYLVMDWVEGENLERLLERQGDPGLSFSAVAGYLEQAAAALDHLHAHDPPIVHGDVKPANLILRPDGRVILVDFGISGLTGATSGETTGTPGFTAPEVSAGAPATPSADVYGLGMTAYALLSGTVPRGGEPVWEGVPSADVAPLERGLRRALATDPARRPRTAGELVERLTAWRSASLPTGVVTFLFTDIEGSTPLWERHPDAMRRALAHHNELVADAVERHHGRLLLEKGEGDSTFSVFERATDAVGCALALQLKFGAESWPEEIAIRVRMSVHTGEAELRGGAYTGNTTNRAARIRSLARGGQILLSQTTAGLVRGALGTGAALADLGEHRLKGLAQEEKVYELCHPALQSEGPPTALETLDLVRQPDDALDTEAHEPASIVPLQPSLAPRDQPVFVGRSADLQQLRDLWVRATGGRREFALLTGEPGIGKTRMAMELARSVHSDGAVVLYGRCDEENLVPYQPFVEIVRHLAGVIDPDFLREMLGPGGGELARIVPELGQRIPNLPEPIRGDPDGERYRLFEAVASFMKTLAGASPLLLLLDDLHWADTPTLLLLKYILRSTVDARLLVLGTAREAEVAPDHALGEMLADIRREHSFERVSLTGLEEPELTPMIAAWAERAPPPYFVRAIHCETEGNPFFVGEVLRHLRDSGVIPEPGAEWGTELAVEKFGIPQGVREVIGHRLSRLSEPCNRALSLASVAGRRFGLDVLERIADLSGDRLLEAIEEARAAGVIEEEPGAADRYAFAHALIRETLYEALSTSRRLRLHRQIGEALEALHLRDPEPYLAELAYHFVEAASLGDLERAVDYATRAGHRALAQLAFEEAATHYARALDVLGRAAAVDEKRRSELLLALGEAQTKAGDKSVAKETLLQAVTSARAAAAAEVIARGALLYVGSTEWSTALFEGDEHPQIALLEEALNVLPQRDEALRVMVLARLAVALYWTNSQDLRDRAEPMSKEALEVARRTGNPAAIAAALEARWYAFWQGENVEDRITDCREALRLARDSGDREQEMRLRRLLIFDSLQLGDASAAQHEIEAHARLAEEVRQPKYAAYTAMFASTKATMEGRYAEGSLYARRAFDIGQGEGGMWAISGGFFSTQMMMIWRVDGSLLEWEPGLREAAETIPIPATRAAMALFLCDLGKLDDARVVFDGLAKDDFRGIQRDFAWLHAIAFLAEVCAALDDTSRAKTLYELLLPYATRNLVSGPPALASFGPVARHLGQLAATLGRTRDAVDHFEAALRMTRDMGARPFTVLTQCDYAAALLNAVHRDRAMTLLDEAMATADQLGMKAIVQRIESLRSRGIQPVLFKAEGTPFIGRVAELERIRRLYTEASAGRGKLVVISGEPGIGKTRLAIEIAAGASTDGANVLYGRCDEDTLVPYQPFVEVLKQLVEAAAPRDLAEMLGAAGGELSRLVPDLRRRVPGLREPIQGDPEGERYRLFEAVTGALGTTAARRPTILVIDDLHWADKPTLLLLKHLLRVSSTGLLVVGIYRESEVTREHPLAGMLADLRQAQGFERISLEGLAEREVAELVGAIAGGTAPSGLARALHDGTEGNPFFLTEVVRHLRESGALEDVQSAGPSEALLTGAGIPESVRDVITRRLSRLSDATKNLLSFGAVVGRAFALDVVARATDIDEDDLLSAVEQAIAARVIEEDPATPDGYTFTHALIRETLYEELGASRRLRFHHRVGVALEELHAQDLAPHLAALSLHFLKAHAGDAQKAIEYSIGAGERAASQLAYEEAANYYRRALDALGSAAIDDEALRSRLLLLLGESQRKSGDPSAKPTLKEALESARRTGDGDTFGHAALLYAGPMLGSTAVLREDRSLEISFLKEAVGMLPDEPNPLLVRILARLAVALFWAFGREEARTLSEKVLDLAQRAGDPTSLSVALSASRYATWTGDTHARLDGARDIQRLARQAGDREQELEADSWILMDLLELGDRGAAIAAMEQYVSLAGELRQPRYLALVFIFQALFEIAEGRFERGQELAKEAMVMGQQVGSIDASSWFVTQMFGVWRWTGVLAGFEPALHQAVDNAPVVAARAGLALWMVDLGRLDEARTELDRIAAHDFDDIPRDLIFVQTLAFLSEVVAALGDRRRAELLHQLLIPFTRFNIVTGVPPLAVWGPVPHFLGMLLVTLERYEEAEEQFQAALRMCGALKAAPLKANTQYVYARMLADLGRSEAGLKLANEALISAESIGMTLLVEQLQELIRAIKAGQLSALSSSLAVRSDRTQFVGRERERAELARRTTEAAEGRGSLILISGEPGVGKTRLAEESALEAATREMLVFVGHCEDGDGGVPYRPFVEALEGARRMLGAERFRAILGDEAPEIARLIPEIRRAEPDLPPPLELPLEQERRFLFNCVVEILSRLGKEQPILLVLDDLQWADDSTTMLLAHLANRLPQMPLAVVGTIRTDESGSGPIARFVADLDRTRLAHEMELEPLPPDDVAEMVGTLADSDVPAPIVDLIAAEAEGNPFFVEELFRYLVEEKKLIDAEGRVREDLTIGEIDVPRSVRRVLGRRLGRLSPELRESLSIAAVVGRLFDPAICAATLDRKPADLVEVLSQAERARFIIPLEGGRGDYGFSHEIVRQCLLAELAAAERRQLHFRVAEAIERLHSGSLDDRSPEIAYHLVESGAADPVKTAGYLKRAAERALSVAAFSDALRWIDQAATLREHDSSSERADVLNMRGLALDGLARWEEAHSEWLAALDMYEGSGQMEKAQRVCADVSVRLGWGGRFMEALAIALRGLDYGPGDAAPDRCRLLGVAGRILGLAGDSDGGHGMVDEAIETAERLGDRRLLGRVIGEKSAVHWSHMDLRGQTELAGKAAQLVRSEGDLWTLADALWMRQIGLLYLGRLAEADEIDRELWPLAHRLGHNGTVMACGRVRAVINLMRTGDLEAYERYAEEDLDLCRAAGFAWISTSHAWLGWARFWRGDWDDALVRFEAAADLEPPGALNGSDSSGLLLARAYRGEHEEALAMLDRIRKRGELPTPGERNSWGSWAMLHAAVEALEHMGRSDEASALYPLVVESMATGALFRSWDARLLEIVAGIAATAGRSWDTAERHFQAAARLADELPFIPEQAEVRRFHGRMLLLRNGSGDKERARAMLGEAVAIYRRLGMPKHEALVTELL
ncbi:MAG: AAA family ATPase [Actinomycetota bacterium]